MAGHLSQKTLVDIPRHHHFVWSCQAQNCQLDLWPVMVLWLGGYGPSMLHSNLTSRYFHLFGPLQKHLAGNHFAPICLWQDASLATVEQIVTSFYVDISWLTSATHVPLSLNKLLGIKVFITLFFETPWAIWIFYNLLFTQSTCVRSVKNAESNLPVKRHTAPTLHNRELVRWLTFIRNVFNNIQCDMFHLPQH
jgi:hypothetical protein